MGDILNYADYDYSSIVQQLQDRLALKGSWKDVYQSGTGQMLLEFNAYILNLVMFYIERAAQESYIQTARNRSSIINLVRLLGYSPKRATSATGHVTFSLEVAHTQDIYFPKYTVVSTKAGIQYFVTEDTVLQKGQTSVTAPIKQGVKSELIVTSDGSIGQEYQIAYTDVENSGIEVYVDNVLWTEQTSFVLGTSTSTWYKVLTNLDDTLTVQFGDNVNAKAPEAQSEVIIRYVRTDGLAGNVYVAGIINSVNSTIYDALSTKITDITVSNADVVSGGDSMEDMDEIRFEAPRVFATGDRAVTKDDYVAILDNYTQVATSNAWGENEEDPPNYDMFNRVKLALVLQGWVFPSETYKQTLSEYLYTKAQLTVKYTFVDPTIIYVIPTLDIKVVKGNTLSTVRSAVEDELTNQFELGVTTKIGVSKRLGDAYDGVEEVTGVSYSHIILKVYKELTAGYDSTSDYGETVDCLPIKAGSVGLYLNDELVATDDGTGGFTDLVSDPVISGTIDYVTGEILVDITPTPAPADVLSVRYEQDESGDIVVEKHQIAKLHETDITSITYDA